MSTTNPDPKDTGSKSPAILSAKTNDRVTLAAIARRAMIERNLEPDFPPAALLELAAITAPAPPTAGLRDLRDWLWASIDNDDSRDLDQLTVAEPLAGGRVRILVAVADVDALVRQDLALDRHAAVAPRHRPEALPRLAPQIGQDPVLSREAS